MTKPPCKADGVDCPRRCVGCREGCEKWQEWVVVHAREKIAMRDVGAELADNFLAGQSKRAVVARVHERQKERDRGINRRIRK